MEELIKIVVDNGIAIACFIAFMYFIFVDKKASNDLLGKINDTLVEVKINLQQLNDRVSVLEKKEKKKDTKEDE